MVLVHLILIGWIHFDLRFPRLILSLLVKFWKKQIQLLRLSLLIIMVQSWMVKTLTSRRLDGYFYIFKHLGSFCSIVGWQWSSFYFSLFVGKVEFLSGCMLLHHCNCSRQLAAAKYKLILDQRIVAGRNYAHAAFSVLLLLYWDKIGLYCVVGPALGLVNTRSRVLGSVFNLWFSITDLIWRYWCASRLSFGLGSPLLWTFFLWCGKSDIEIVHLSVVVRHGGYPLSFSIGLMAESDHLTLIWILRLYKLRVVHGSPDLFLKQAMRSWIVVTYTTMDSRVLATVAVFFAVTSIGGIFLEFCTFSVVFVAR